MACSLLFCDEQDSTRVWMEIGTKQSTLPVVWEM